MHVRAATPCGRLIVPDYVRPDALCVPFWHFDIRESLEELARRASEQCGVVLIARDPSDAKDFADATGRPEHFGIVSGGFDSPWLRDHAPIAVAEAGVVHLIRPARPPNERVNDLHLFETILPAAHETTELCVAGGNLVAGAGGLAVSTCDVLTENVGADADALRGLAAQLGLRDWLIVEPLPDDISAHADTMLRFLTPDLCALCVRPDLPEYAAKAEDLEERLGALRPGLAILRLPAVARDGAFNSPINWVQLGSVLLVPAFGGDDPYADERAARLSERGFLVVPIHCETAGLGGALHCLTASIFATPPRQSDSTG